MTIEELVKIGFEEKPSTFGDDLFQRVLYKFDNDVVLTLAGYNYDWRLQELSQPNGEDNKDIISIPKRLETIDDVQKLINALT